MKRYAGRAGAPLRTCLLLGLTAAAPCLAASIYDNLGSGNTFIVNREYDTNVNFMAASFVTTNGGRLGDILTPIFSLDSPAMLGLYSDSAGKPGSQLESWSATVPGLPGQLVTLTSVENPLLSAGTQYWFVIALTAAQKNSLAWYQNNRGIAGGVWAGNSLDSLLEFEPASPAPAIQLNAATVPEPATRSLTAACALLLVALPCAARRLGTRS